MKRLLVSLHAAQGDAPGYLREALDILSPLGLVDNSDLYIISAPMAGGAAAYTAIATLVTDRSFADLCDALEILPAVRLYPLVLEDGSTDIDLQSDAVTALLNSSMSEDGVTAERIPGTAHVQPPPIVDYDTPGGAGEQYDTVRPLSDFTRQLFETAARALNVRPGTKVLDVGCGTGRFCLLFAERGADVTGLDRSDVMLAHARAATAKSGYNVRYVCADGRTELTRGPFNAIAFFMSIHYFELTPTFFQLLRGSLAREGRVAIATLPHRHFIENEFLTRYFPSIPRIDLARFPSIPRLVRLLNENGFENIEEYELVTESVTPMTTMIELVERKYVSTLHLLDTTEFRAGLAAMRDDARRRQALRRKLRATVISAHVLQGKASPATAANK